MSGRFSSRFVVVALAVLTLASASAAEAPTTAPADFTEHEYRRAMFDFNRRTLVDAYKTIGHRDAKWDEPAIKLLEGIAVYFTNAYIDGKCKVEGTEPWMLNLIGGVYHIQAAWAARGRGFADTVTPEGCQGFGRHLAAARQCLNKAMALEPKFPEAAAYMIEVSMGQDDGQERIWFDRAVAAQIDYLPAYQYLRWALRPRWGG